MKIKRIISLFLISLFFTLNLYAEKVRVFKRPDGGVSVFYPVIKSKKPNESETDWYNRVCTEANVDGLPFVDIDTSDFPSSRKYRNCWEFDNATKKVKVNQAKKQQVDNDEAKKDTDKAGAKTKLKALGLTEDEIEALK